MSDPRVESADHADRDCADPALWQRHELLAGPGTGPTPEPGTETSDGLPVAPACGARAPDTGAEGLVEDAGLGEETVAVGETVDPVEVQLAPGSLPIGPGRVALPVSVVRPRELQPYLARHPHGDQHRGHGLITIDHDGRPVRGEHGQWDYRAPGLRGWCRCGWNGPTHPQKPIPAEHQHSPAREKAWREVNRAARRAIEGEWLDHVYIAVPSLKITVLHWQREIIKRAFPDAVAHARRYRAPWQEVGDELGVSRQSAHQSWRHLDPPRDSAAPAPGHGAVAADPAVTPMCARCDHAQWAHEAFEFNHAYVAPAPGDAARVRDRGTQRPPYCGSQNHDSQNRDGGEPVD